MALSTGSSAALASWSQTAYDADKPMLLSEHLLRTKQLTAANLFWSSSGTHLSASDETYADQPTSWLYDNNTHLVSAVDPFISGTAYLHIDLGVTLGEFDTIAFLGNRNWGDLTNLAILVSDDSSHVNSETILNTSSNFGNGTRAIYTNLRHTGTDPLRYTDIRYIRVEFTVSGVGWIGLGEVVIGNRRQLTANPIEPWGYVDVRTQVSDFTSNSGVITRHVKNKGQRVIGATLQEYDSSPIDDMIDFFREDTEGGTQPFLWIDNPSSDPHSGAWMRFDQPNLIGPTYGPYERRFTLQAHEIGPDYQALE